MALNFSGFNWDAGQGESGGGGGGGDGLSTADVTAIVDAKLDALTPANIGAVAGNDPRLSDARTPTAHKLTHATGGSDALSPADIGAAASDDARLSDARTPIRHASTHVASGDDPLTAEDIGAAPLGAIADIAGLRSDVDGLMQDISNREHFRGYYETTAQIAALSSPGAGNYAYNAETGTKWLFNAGTSAWENSGVPVPDQTVPPSDAVPLTDGAASAGTSNEYARGDHRHQILADASTSLAGKVMLATVNDTTSADKAATPAGVAAQVAPVLAVANAAQSTANAATDAAQAAEAAAAEAKSTASAAADAAQAALDAVEGAVTEVTWDNIADKPAEFFPAPHAATHLPGGSDPIEGLGEGDGGSISVSGSGALGSIIQYLSNNVPAKVVVLHPTEKTILKITDWPELYAIVGGSFGTDQLAIDEFALPPYSVETAEGFVWGITAAQEIVFEPDYQIVPLVPMTSNNTPAPYIASASSYFTSATYGAMYPWKLFDGEDNLGWAANNNTGACWCALNWQEPKFVYGYEVYPRAQNASRTPEITLGGLLEGGTYVDFAHINKPAAVAEGKWMRYLIPIGPHGPYYGLRWSSAAGREGWNWSRLRVLTTPINTGA